MASANAIEIKKLEELKRRNTADIDNQQRLAAAREQEVRTNTKLAVETIQNNLRNYKINLDKNKIQKLANDQLDDRESRKLLETIRNNIATLIEQNRHNMKTEELQAAENEIKELDVMLQGAKPVGKDAKAVVTSFMLNQAMLQAFTGKSVPERAISWAWDYLGSPVPNPTYHDVELNPNSGIGEGVLRYTKDDEGGLIKSGVLKGKYYNKGTNQVFDTAEEYEASLDENKSGTPSQIIKGGKGNERITSKEESVAPSRLRRSTSSVNVQEETSPSNNQERVLDRINGRKDGSQIIDYRNEKSEQKQGPGWGLIS